MSSTMSLFKIIIFITILTLNKSSSLNIVACEWNWNKFTMFGLLRECSMTNLTMKVLEDDSIMLEKIPRNFNFNFVKSFQIYKSADCHFIPQTIVNYFENLEVLIISECGLKSISSDELKIFNKLRGIFLEENQIETLSGNLFQYNQQLEVISMRKNNIQIIDAGIFENLKYLKIIELSENACVDKIARTVRQMEELLRKISANCVREIKKQKKIKTPNKISEAQKPSLKVMFEEFLLQRFSEIDRKYAQHK